MEVSRELNVARWVRRSRANGPGERFVLWVQGCGLACPGCWNEDTWSFAQRRSVSVKTLLDEVRSVSGIEGITLSGGEPFTQAAALIPLVRALREDGLSVVVFTGFERSELRSAPARDLLALTDVLVAGRYDEAQRDLSRPLRGSRNKSLHFLTERYRPQDLESIAQAEIELDDEGRLTVLGFPPDELRAELSSLVVRGN